MNTLRSHCEVKKSFVLAYLTRSSFVGACVGGIHAIAVRVVEGNSVVSLSTEDDAMSNVGNQIIVRKYPIYRLLRVYIRRASYTKTARDFHVFVRRRLRRAASSSGVCISLKNVCTSDK